MKQIWLNLTSNNVISALHSFTYRVNVQIAGTQATFIPDTGAAVTLLHKDVWDAAQPHLPLCELKLWTGDGLIGAGGTPLQTVGCTNMDLAIAGGKFPSEVIVVDSLMTEGILGVDFLKKHRCNVDLKEGRQTVQWKVLNCSSKQGGRYKADERHIRSRQYPNTSI